MSDGWSKEIDRNARECQSRHERNAELANDAFTKACFCERRLAWLTGEDGDNGAVGNLRKSVDDHEQRIRKTEALNLKFAGAVVVLAAAAVAVFNLILQRIGGAS